MSAIVTGDDPALEVTLRKGGVTFSIPGTATVKALLVSKDREIILIPEVICSISAAGADWPNSLVIVQFTEIQTAALTVFDSALLEVQVDDNGKITWFESLEIIKGNIA